MSPVELQTELNQSIDDFLASVRRMNAGMILETDILANRAAQTGMQVAEIESVVSAGFVRLLSELHAELFK